MRSLLITVSFVIVLCGFAHATTEVNITVSKVPKIINPVDRLNHPEGTNASFVCSIGSGEIEGLTFEWLQDEKRISASSKMRISILPDNFNSILRVIDLKPEDSGTYSCIARNSFGQDKISTKLFVKVQLKWIHEPPKEAKYSTKRQVHIPCIASGQPEPKTEWRKLMDNGETQFVGSELHFPSINQADAGEYECRASNGLEEDLVSSLKLRVLGKY